MASVRDGPGPGCPRGVAAGGWCFRHEPGGAPAGGTWVLVPGGAVSAYWPLMKRLVWSMR